MRWPGDVGDYVLLGSGQQDLTRLPVVYQTFPSTWDSPDTVLGERIQSGMDKGWGRRAQVEMAAESQRPRTRCAEGCTGSHTWGGLGEELL